MSKFIDITNLKFGKLLVVENTFIKNKYGQIYWRCICDCGKEVVVLATSLRCKNTTSCGCWRILANAKYSPEEASARRAYKNIKYDKRGIENNISFEYFYNKSQDNCYYCNAPPSNLIKSENHSDYFKSNGNFAYNGFDRVDSSKGYSEDNVVTCCKYCNKAKSSFSINEFCLHINKILLQRKSLFNDDFSLLKDNFKIIKSIPTINFSDNTNIFLVKPNAIIGKLLVIKELENKYFLCKCQCGIIKNISFYSLKLGKSKSCGKALCYKKYPPEIYKARKIWITRYKDENLSFDDFYSLSQMNCIYCNTDPFRSVHARNNKAFIYNGLDRVDSSIGHHLDNVVPCCYDCNKMKNDRTLLEFNNWLNNIKLNWISKY